MNVPDPVFLPSDAFPRSNTIAFHPDQVGPSHQHTTTETTTPQAKNFPRTGTIEFGGNIGGREGMGNAGTLGRRVNAGGYGGPNVERCKQYDLSMSCT